MALQPTFLNGEMMRWDWNRDTDTLDINAGNAANDIINELNGLVNDGIIEKHARSSFDIRPVFKTSDNEYKATTYNYIFINKMVFGFLGKREYLISVYYEKEKLPVDGGLGDYSVAPARYIRNGHVRIQGYLRLVARICDAYSKGKKKVFPYSFLINFRIKYYVSAFSILLFIFGTLMFFRSLWEILIRVDESTNSLQIIMIVMIASLLMFILLGGSVGFEEVQTDKGKVRGNFMESIYIRTGNSLPKQVYSNNHEDDDIY